MYIFIYIYLYIYIYIYIYHVCKTRFNKVRIVSYFNTLKEDKVAERKYRRN